MAGVNTGSCGTVSGSTPPQSAGTASGSTPPQSHGGTQSAPSPRRPPPPPDALDEELKAIPGFEPLPTSLPPAPKIVPLAAIRKGQKRIQDALGGDPPDLPLIKKREARRAALPHVIEKNEKNYQAKRRRLDKEAQALERTRVTDRSFLALWAEEEIDEVVNRPKDRTARISRQRGKAKERLEAAMDRNLAEALAVRAANAEARHQETLKARAAIPSLGRAARVPPPATATPRNQTGKAERTLTEDEILLMESMTLEDDVRQRRGSMNEYDGN